MKIFDCFMFFDEEVLLDLRLNYLNSYVDEFVIVESLYTHSGEKRKLLFNINTFKKFKDKISYIVVDKEPDNISKVSITDSEDKKNSKYILNAAKRENFQRNYIQKGLAKANPEDMILISDLDEIPNLETNDLKNIKSKLIFFKQKLFYYKFNLKFDSFNWFGTKACKMAHLASPQWLRNIKDKRYPFWRLDTLCSRKKYQDIFFVENGGWHFSYMKTAESIEKKLTSYLHHREYDINPLGKDKIQEMINNKKPVYDLCTDMKKSKFEGGQELVVSETNELPNYIQKNLEKYRQWLE
jgi:beta-1,4-mannosyl-glycoprotein beta-1,4-N-acetylglucosaminyltransferase